MKKKNETKNPYRSLGFGKVSAPSTPKDNPKGEKLVGKGDLRTGKK